MTRHHDDDLVEHLAYAVAEKRLAVMDLDGITAGAVVVTPEHAAAAVLDALNEVGLYPDWDARRRSVPPDGGRPGPDTPTGPGQAATREHAASGAVIGERVVDVRVLLDADRAPDDALAVIERAFCPTPGEPGHAARCPLLAASAAPLTDDPDAYDKDPAALAWARAKVEHVIDGVNRLRRLVGQTRTPTDAALLNLYATWLRRDFQHGGPHLAAFDPRHAQETE